MSLDNYVAFYVAAPHHKLQPIMDEYTLAHNLRNNLTIGYEISKHSHKQVQGEHIHVLAKWTDKQYRAFIQFLKTKDINMQGRAIRDQPRTYGKVNKIKDFKKMLAYTIKGGQFISTESLDLIAECRDISFQKEEDTISTLRILILEYLDKTLEWKRENFCGSGVPPFKQQGHMYPLHCSEYTPLCYVKASIVQFFRDNCDYKMPCKSRVMYFAQYYMMYHKNPHSNEYTFPLQQLLEIFF